MADADVDLVNAALTETIAVHERLREGDARPVVDAARIIAGAIRQGGKLLVFGNGGSAADAQHVAAELVGRFQRERSGFAAVALTTDTSALTSIANDYGFERVFARQVEALGRQGDAALGISTSGRSPNIVAAMAAARARGLRTIALIGRDPAALSGTTEILVSVPSDSTPRVQEAHRTLLHVICELVERELTEDTKDTKDTKKSRQDGGR
jgi:D-sedoheptulose 7-phosphate isomerase